MNTRFSSEMKATRAYEFRQRERESAKMNESTKYKRILYNNTNITLLKKHNQIAEHFNDNQIILEGILL